MSDHQHVNSKLFYTEAAALQKEIEAELKVPDPKNEDTQRDDRERSGRGS